MSAKITKCQISTLKARLSPVRLCVHSTGEAQCEIIVRIQPEFQEKAQQ